MRTAKHSLTSSLGSVCKFKVLHLKTFLISEIPRFLFSCYGKDVVEVANDFPPLDCVPNLKPIISLTLIGVREEI